MRAEHVFAAVIGITAILTGCPHVTESDRKQVTAYEAEQLLCIDKATTRAESQACRCEVKKRYGRECQ